MADDCAAALVPTVTYGSFADHQRLGILQIIERDQYQKMQNTGSAGLSIPVYGVPISATTSYEDFYEKRNQEFKRFGYAYSRDIAVSYFSSALSETSRGAYESCLRQRALERKLESGGLYHYVVTLNEDAAEVVVGYVPPPNDHTTIRVSAHGLEDGNIKNKADIERTINGPWSGTVRHNFFVNLIDPMKPGHFVVTRGAEDVAIHIPPLKSLAPTEQPPEEKPPRIVSVSAPVDSCDGGCWPISEQTWRAEFPIRDPARIGIGHIVEPAPLNLTQLLGTLFAMHDHHMLAPQVPDPNRAMVTYTFDKITEIAEVEIIQHANGITQIEGFIGNTENDVETMGIATSSLGNIPEGNMRFVDASADVFKFSVPRNGRVFRFIVRKTSKSDGYATYRAYPRNARHQNYAPASLND